MSEAYKPKFDFSAWEAGLTERIQSKFREIEEWAKAEELEIRKSAKTEIDEILREPAQKGRGTRISDVKRVEKLRLETLSHQAREKAEQVLDYWRSEKAILESEQKVDSVARNITDEIFNAFFQKLEKEFGAKSDAEIQVELDEREKQANSGNKNKTQNE